MQKTNERDSAFRNGDWGVKYFMRGPRIDWGVILLHPGQTMGEHGHREVEETYYVVEGTPTIMVDGKPHASAPGDIFRIEAPERHDIVNDGTTDARLIFIKAPYLPDDKT